MRMDGGRDGAGMRGCIGLPVRGVYNPIRVHWDSSEMCAG